MLSGVSVYAPSGLSSVLSAPRSRNPGRRAPSSRGRAVHADTPRRARRSSRSLSSLLFSVAIRASNVSRFRATASSFSRSPARVMSPSACWSRKLSAMTSNLAMRSWAVAASLALRSQGLDSRSARTCCSTYSRRVSGSSSRRVTKSRTCASRSTARWLRLGQAVP